MMQSVFALTTSITILIYYVITRQNEKFKHRNKIFLTLSIVVPVALNVPALFIEGSAPCHQGNIYYNCSCPNPTISVFWPILWWSAPSVILLIMTLMMMLRIHLRRVKLQ